MKDPACLFYISDWLTSTKEMKADERGWYLNLILHQYDKGDLPNNVEELANLADVRFSEFEHFKQVFEQVLKHKFKVNESGRLENETARVILQKRKAYTEKRSKSGMMSYVVRFISKHYKKATNGQIEYVKNNIDLDNIDLKNEQVFKQVLEHLFELYRNVNENEDIDKDINERIKEFELEILSVNNKNKILSEPEVRKFIDYWTEAGSRAKKFRREKQDPWDTKRRLERWRLNNYGKNQRNNEQVEANIQRNYDETPDEALAAIKAEREQSNVGKS